MALVIADRVVETSTTTGTGTYSLNGAVDGFQTFVGGIGDSNETFYCCTDGTDWEVGIGTVTDGSPDTLSRDEIIASSNGGSAVSWGAGSKTLFVDVPASRRPVIDDANAVVIPTINNAPKVDLDADPAITNLAQFRLFRDGVMMGRFLYSNATDEVGIYLDDTTGEVDKFTIRTKDASGVLAERFSVQNGVDTADIVLTADVGLNVSVPRQVLHVGGSGARIRVSDTGAASTTAATPVVEFYQGENTALMGFFGFTSAGDVNMEWRNALNGDAEIWTNNIMRWRVSASGHLLANADGTYDFGATGATRPRNIMQTGYHELEEMTAPSSPGANCVRIYAADDGSGKTALYALFPSGAAQQIAIEP